MYFAVQMAMVTWLVKYIEVLQITELGASDGVSASPLTEKYH